MKSIYSIALVSFFGLMIFASCKKDYSCKCTGSVSGSVMGTTINESDDTTIALGKLKKKDAKSKCSDWQNTFKSQMDASIAAANAAGGNLSGSVSCDVK